MSGQTPFFRYIDPFVKRHITRYRLLSVQGEHEKAFAELEKAHVLGQSSTFHHTYVHCCMLIHGLKIRSWKETGGQVVRLIGALTKTPFGLVPPGNTGGSNVSPFEPMPLSAEHSRILKGYSRNQN